MAKKTSAHKKAVYEAYRKNGQAEKNAAKKLARHLKKHPADLQSANHVIPNFKKNKDKA